MAFYSGGELPHIQVFHNDHASLCIRPAIDTDRNYITFHGFDIITIQGEKSDTPVLPSTGGARLEYGGLQRCTRSTS